MRRIVSGVIFGIILLGPVSPVALAQPTKLSDASVLDHLNQAISWYLHLVRLDTSAGRPSDELYLQNARTLARQVLQLAFQSAQEEAELIEEEGLGGTAATPSGQTSDQQKIAQGIANTTGRIRQIQSQIDTVSKEIKSARGKKRENLLSQREALQGKLDLEKALLDALGKLSGFTKENTKSGLTGKITRLKQSVPDLAPAEGGKASKPDASQPAPKSSRASSSGLIGQTAVLFSLMGDVRDIDQLIEETTGLRNAAQQLQTPLRDSLRALLQEGRSVADQPPSSDPAQREGTHRNLEALKARFQQISSAALPLRQEMIVLDQCRANLAEWRNSTKKEYSQVLRSLLTHVLIILIALGIVMIFSEIWRRATFRYVHEPRRRRQILLLRRFVTGFLMVTVIIFGFVSEFSSLATFAGFITAGMAVALQTVILSIAAYFFLIGRYGVRVGDRVTVSGVTGDVINIGLVRFHLMELAGTGIDLYPTGRTVVFSNSVLFQASPFFKQIPGTAYTWHEAAVTLAPGADFALAERKLLEAVNSVYAEYKESITRQHEAIETRIDLQISAPAPQAQLHFVENGLEFVVRYPVEIQQASAIDDRITRKLMEGISGDPDLKAAVSGAPRLRAAIKG